MQVSSLTHAAKSTSTGTAPRDTGASRFASLLTEAASGGETNALPKIEVPADAIKVPAFVLPEGGGGETDPVIATDARSTDAPRGADGNDLIKLSGGTTGVSDSGSTGSAGAGKGTLGSGAGVSEGSPTGIEGIAETQEPQPASTSSIQNLMARVLASQYAGHQLPPALNQIL